MDASERVSWADCPNCGGLVAVSWRDGDAIAVDCVGGCRLRLERGRISAVIRDPAGVLGDAEQMASLLEDAVVEASEAYGLSDFRVAAGLVADTWADILREEGRSLRLTALATAAVREVGARLHRQQISVRPRNSRNASTDIRVLVVDDHPLARVRLTEMLAGEADISVVGECGLGSQVVEAAARLRPHIVCLDRSMPAEDALAATRALRAADPGVRIVLVSSGGEARLDVALAGADALVPTDAGRHALLRCLRTVASRGTECPYCL
ncbi:Signal transduction response regulator, receiver domain [Modestobacter italicus]|uniref:Signal transduction response regulator, receiver domain n=2 Tax=Modestobacter italicus (strain DSM 44449 / CECT 9708 / BC 501) TaxID=2732864 RepID=I4EWN5_MODI5|nr:Signal transduction response regulator, receiver domain [Modestobacter marinus]